MEMPRLELIKAKDASVADRYKEGTTSIANFVDDYINGRIDIEGDMYEFIQQRNLYVNYMPVLDHLKFIITRMVPEVLIHSQEQDTRIVQDHYDRGNDFFNWFLDDVMIYTSGYYRTGKETLEEAQINKMNAVCQKLHMKEGDKYLDIGCGWGTLVAHAAEHYGADATGVTIAEQGAEHIRKMLKGKGLDNKARVLNMDYRDIPKQKFDKISCLEMAEHVGVLKFQGFMQQIYDMLEDDGLFYLQIAGLRAGFHLEDLVWGLFMNKYIFSGADASTPLSWVIDKLENVNFEIHNVENIGIHYSKTIYAWYENWMRNEDKVMKKYGQWWFRLWEIFLAWSTEIAAQGSSTAFMITCHKNLDEYDRTKFIGEPSLGKF